MRELDMAHAASTHIATRPSMTFHGNMQVAVAEARNLVEQGNRVVFFAQSNGELERMADILQEYSVPFQLGYRAGRRHAAVSGGAVVYGGHGRQHVPGEGKYTARRGVPRIEGGGIRVGGFVRHLRRGGACPGLRDRNWARSRPTSRI